MLGYVKEGIYYLEFSYMLFNEICISPTHFS